MSWSVRNIAASSAAERALDDVTLEIRPGRLHGVIGGDGAGKSTLLKVLVGLDVGQRGSVSLPPAEKISFVPSDGGIFGDLTVEENVEFVADTYSLREWRARSEELLERAAIGRFAQRVAGKMSGGQRRKLAGCLALLPQPELLVLDELTTGVDPVSRMEIWRLITAAAAEGAAVVTATTYLDEAERMEHVVLLHRGRALSTGSPADITASVPGSVTEVDAPTDRSRAWRHGRRWRQWDPAGERRADTLGAVTFEDATIVLELVADEHNPGTAPTRDEPVRSLHPDPVRNREGRTSRVEVDVENTITAHHLSRTFGDFIAVDDVDLHVAPGEIVGLLGANGAGKTTVIKMLLGLLEPTSGTVRVFGEPHSRRQRRRLGYVPQNLGLYTDLTADENLEFRADVFGVDEVSPTVLDGVDSEVLIGKQPLGLQRRTAFAVATQHHPELLILDEPTSGVSPLSRSRLWDLIHTHADAGVGVLVSTHYMDEAVQADRLIVMSAGRVVAGGSIDEVVDGRRTVEVVTDRWADAFDLLDRAGTRLRLAGRSIRIVAGDVDEIRSQLRAAHIDATVDWVPATLEEVLIDLDAREPAAT